MTNLGNQTTPASPAVAYTEDIGSFQLGTTFVMPAGGGQVSDIYVFVGADQATAGTVQLCLWDANRNLIATTSSVTLPVGTRTPGGQSFVHVGSLSVPVLAGQFRIGLWTTSPIVWTPEIPANDTSFDQRAYYQSNVNSPGYFTEDGVLGVGGLGAYVTYSGTATSTPPIMRLERSSAWTAALGILEYRSGNWVSLTTYDVERTGVWTPPT